MSNTVITDRWKIVNTQTQQKVAIFCGRNFFFSHLTDGVIALFYVHIHTYFVLYALLFHFLDFLRYVCVLVPFPPPPLLNMKVM